MTNNIPSFESLKHNPPVHPGPMNVGMYLRDYFAAAALTGFLSLEEQWHSMSCESAAEWAYKHADAMLAERTKHDN